MLEGDNQKFTEYEKELWQFENKWIYKRTFFKKMGKLIQNFYDFGVKKERIPQIYVFSSYKWGAYQRY